MATSCFVQRALPIVCSAFSSQSQAGSSILSRLLNSSTQIQPSLSVFISLKSRSLIAAETWMSRLSSPRFSCPERIWPERSFPDIEVKSAASDAGGF